MRRVSKKGVKTLRKKVASTKKRKTMASSSGYKLPAMLTSKGSEKKALDIPVTATDFLTAGTIIPLNIVTQGAAFYNRIGSRIELSSIQFRGFINPNTNPPSGVDIGRIILFYDRQTNGVLPTRNELLQNRDLAGNATNAGLVGINLDNRDRFLVIRDQHIFFPESYGAVSPVVASVNTTSKEGMNELLVNVYVKLKGLTTQFKANAGNIGNISSGGLFLLFISQAVNNKRNCTWTTRLRFKDS